MPNYALAGTPQRAFGSLSKPTRIPITNYILRLVSERSRSDKTLEDGGGTFHEKMRTAMNTVFGSTGTEKYRINTYDIFLVVKLAVSRRQLSE